MTEPDRRRFSEILGQMTVAVHSANLNWVHWLRLWWGISDYMPHKLPGGETHPPQTLTPDDFVLS